MPENTIEKSIKKSERKKAGKFLSFLKGLLALILFIVAVGVVIFGINIVTNMSVKETYYQYGSSKLESNVRIVQISDLHNATLFGGNDAVINRVKKLKPDVIALTGDMIEQNDRNYNVALDFCGKLAEIAPTYYVYGNDEITHEYNLKMTKKELDSIYAQKEYDTEKGYSFAEEHRTLQAELESRGVKVLLDHMDTVTIGQNKIDIYGVLTFNPSAFWPYATDDLNRYISENTEDNLKVMLCHAPYLLTYYEDSPLGELVLSGHTHGGVIRIPGLGAVYESIYGFLPERNNGYIYGAYEFTDKVLIVNSGLTNRGLIRINNQPEIVIVDVNKY